MPINSKLVHVSRLTDPIEGRAEGAWLIQYRGQSFVTDVGGANAEPFHWKDQAHEPVDFDVVTQEELAGVLHVNPALLGFMQKSDPSFPAPLLAFREGPIWDASMVDAWLPTRGEEALDTRDRSRPRT
jgi:hypothetical protein